MVHLSTCSTNYPLCPTGLKVHSTRCSGNNSSLTAYTKVRDKYNIRYNMITSEHFYDQKLDLGLLPNGNNVEPITKWFVYANEGLSSTTRYVICVYSQQKKTRNSIGVNQDLYLFVSCRFCTVSTVLLSEWLSVQTASTGRRTQHGLDCWWVKINPPLQSIMAA